MMMLTEVKSQRKMLILAILCVLVIFVVLNNPAVLTQFRHSFILLNQNKLVVEVNSIQCFSIFKIEIIRARMQINRY
jgi:hypothetical protein